jgi:hypothetical protein
MAERHLDAVIAGAAPLARPTPRMPALPRLDNG